MACDSDSVGQEWDLENPGDSDANKGWEAYLRLQAYGGQILRV